MIIMLINFTNKVDNGLKKLQKDLNKFHKNFFEDFKRILMEIKSNSSAENQEKAKNEDKKAEINSNVNKAEIDNKRERMESLKKLHQLNAIAESLDNEHQMDLFGKFNSVEQKNSGIKSIKNDAKQDDEFEASNNFSDS